MNRRNEFHPQPPRDPQRSLPRHGPRAGDDARYAYRESLAPRYGQDPRSVDPYGVGLSQAQGGYVDRASRPLGNADSYQRVRPWGPQDGVDRRGVERTGSGGSGERGRRAARHDAVVGADDHGLGPDIASTSDGRARDFRGRGPKGYQRSDERLKEEISERLRDDPRIDASEITVDVTGGRVSLSGEVDSRRTKHEVEDLVDACRGVQEIDNRLRIRSAAGADGR